MKNTLLLLLSILLLYAIAMFASVALDTSEAVLSERCVYLKQAGFGPGYSSATREVQFDCKDFKPIKD